MPANAHDVERIETLIAYASANAEAYREAANDAEGFRAAAPLAHRAQERQAVAAHLQAYLRAGPADESSGDLTLRAPVVAVRRAAAPTDAEVVEAAVRDEGELQAAFEAALDDRALSAPARETVLKAYVAVRTGTDQIRDLRRALRDGP
ncbi:MAG: PA2169 family four-helix-bundle protein [Xanthomonadaceae bacterium]|nr:PA2169 family four-helix-bundle protein [Xanthomonadaceae bacterium]MDE1965036.1 PA2169 family four-helix-bundle protein [Xanthomonadaceae bacterium]